MVYNKYLTVLMLMTYKLFPLQMQVSLFSTRLMGQQIGLSAANLFIIDKSMVLTVSR